MKRFAVITLTLFIVLCIGATAFFFGIGYYLSPQDELVKADAVVAISGGDTAARTKEAVRIYQQGLASHLIFSGAALDPNSPSNAKTMATAAVVAGVPKSNIELDETAANTRQNAAGVATNVNQAGYHSIILVTSPYHQRRADITFHRALGGGFTIINHSSYDDQWRRSHWWATPVSRELTFAELQKVAFELISGPAK